MLKFDPRDPFPLTSPGQCTYREAQLHSEKVDLWLGLNTEVTERKISQSQAREPDQELWIGLPPQTLLTPYTEIRSILEILKLRPGSILVDLGAGYGRMGLVIERHYPEISFLGYEWVAARVEAAQALFPQTPLTRVHLIVADLNDPDFKPISADAYFIYDFGSRAAIEKTLQDLRSIARERSITVVGRGRGCRDAIERNHPWLSQIAKPEHYPHFSIYRSNSECGENSHV